MVTYKEHEVRVRHFIDVRNTFLLIPPDAFKHYVGGLQGLVWTRVDSVDHNSYMTEVSRFIKHGRVSQFMKSHLLDRLSKEFIVGWDNQDELNKETGILFADLGIDLNGKQRAGRFKFYSRRFGPEVERDYFLKYRDMLEANLRVGLPLLVDLRAWDQYQGYPGPVQEQEEGVSLIQLQPVRSH